VVALTPDERIVLIRQYRFGLREVTLEIPGGLISPGESPQAAAIRELKEETGFEPGRIRLIGQVKPNPAFLDNTCYTFLVEDAQEAGRPDQDPAEDIVVDVRPVGDVPGLIERGEINHGLVLNAFYWWRRDKGLV